LRRSDVVYSMPAQMMKNSPVSNENRPIAFPIGPENQPQPPQSGPAENVIFQTRARALDGMQKEALVQCSAGGTAWRLLCDEGPWLNGTDLAPFPLGYFAAGVAACLMSDILTQASKAGVQLGMLNLRVDHFFTMEGSILRGTMAAGVDPIHLAVDTEGDLDDAELEGLVTTALNECSAANRALGNRLPSRFCLTVNGQAITWPGNASRQLDGAADPVARFERLQTKKQTDLPQAIISKDENTSVTAGEGAVGLQSDQKRTVHIHSDACLRADGLKEIAVQCLTPQGSRFVFLSDDAPEAGGQGRAPCGFTYLSAGVAFCFLTQLGRYAAIKKMKLLDYRVVQNTSFGTGSEDPLPVETAVFLDSEDSAENNLQMVRMGEQTCYLHTAFREPVEVVVNTK